MKEDRKNWMLWNIGAEISFMIDATGKYPTIEQVRNYPSVALYCSEISDNEIGRIINNIKRII